MKRAIFLGTFNPPHKGHCDVLQSVIEALPELEKIYVIPCWQNPNKDKSTPYDDRYEMCKRQFNGISKKVEIVSTEKWLKPTYTYELIDYIREVIDDFWWVVTEETYEELLSGKWKECKKLLAENKFIIVNFSKSHPEWLSIDYNRAMKENRIKHVYLREGFDVKVHSTQIREMIKEGKDVSAYINEQTEEYIKKRTEEYNNKNEIFK